MKDVKSNAKSGTETVKKNGTHVASKGKDAGAKATPDAKDRVSGAPAKVKEANDMIAEGGPVVPGVPPKVEEAPPEDKEADAHVRPSAR